jgi:hypothetical protein
MGEEKLFIFVVIAAFICTHSTEEKGLKTRYDIRDVIIPAPVNILLPFVLQIKQSENARSRTV